MGTLQNTPESLSDTLKWPIREMAKFGSIFVGEVLPKDQLKLLLGCKLGCDRSGSKLKRSLWGFSQLVT